MYLSKAKTSRSHKMWTEVCSSVPHFLHMGSFPNPIIHRCLLKVLCPVSRPITTLVWVLLRDNSRAPVARSGPEINSRACLYVLQVPRHNARCCFPIPEDKVAGPWTSPLFSVQYPGMNAWNYTSASPYVFLAWWYIPNREKLDNSLKSFPNHHLPFIYHCTVCMVWYVC